MLAASTAALGLATAFVHPGLTDVVSVSDDAFSWIELPPEAANHVLAFRYGDVVRSDRAAIFDFDGTLANPIVCMGHRCADDTWDGYREWGHTFAHEVRPRLEALAADGFKIVIVSNQGPLEYASPRRPGQIGRDVAEHLPLEKKGQWVEKLLEFVQLLNNGEGGAVTLPVQVFGLLDGSKESGFQKPCASWWRLFPSLEGNGELDCAASFYTGDAGGRLRGDTTNPWQNGTDQWNEDGYWAASDRQFAFTGGVAYKTPEEVFAGAPPPNDADYHKESFENDWCDRGVDTSPWCKRPGGTKVGRSTQ